MSRFKAKKNVGIGPELAGRGTELRQLSMIGNTHPIIPTKYIQSRATSHCDHILRNQGLNIYGRFGNGKGNSGRGEVALLRMYGSNASTLICRGIPSPRDAWGEGVAHRLFGCFGGVLLVPRSFGTLTSGPRQGIMADQPYQDSLSSSFDLRLSGDYAAGQPALSRSSCIRYTTTDPVSFIPSVVGVGVISP
jgi:hypothetical protein